LSTPWLDLPLMVAVILFSRLIAPRLRFAAADTAVQLAGGLLLGPSGLDWLQLDDLVTFLSALGMGYLLFTAGMELELRVRHPGQRMRAMAAQVGSVLIALPFAFVLSAVAHIDDQAAVTAALLTTLVMPALTVFRTSGDTHKDLADFTILAATYGEIAAAIVILLSSIGANVGVSVTVLALLLGGVSALRPLRRNRASRGWISGSSGRVSGAYRLALGVLALSAVLTPALGDKVVLPALAAGIWFSSQHRRRASWNALRARLDGVGLTVLAPMSFVAAGAHIHTTAMDSGELLTVPLLILAMSVCRMVPTLVFARGAAGSRAASGLLLSTKLTLVVVAVQVGQQTGSLTSGSASALVLSGVLTVCVFPTIARYLMRLRTVARGCPRGAATVVRRAPDCKVILYTYAEPSDKPA
jgi:Kef-type K+ transport system membrane component KefB